MSENHPARRCQTGECIRIREERDQAVAEVAELRTTLRVVHAAAGEALGHDDDSPTAAA